MPDTATTKLALVLPDPASNYDVGVVNANNTKIDDAIGATICTSSTRPATPNVGRQIRESDTSRSLVWDGTFWRDIGTLIGVANTAAQDALANPVDGMMVWNKSRDWITVHDGGGWKLRTIGLVADVADRAAVVSPLTGTTIYRSDKKWIECWDGTAWRVQGIGVCTSNTDRDTNITNPATGQVCFTTDTNTLWQRKGGVWVEIPDQPRVSARATATQSIPNTTYTAINFDTDDLDPWSIHDTVTNTSRITVTRAGAYWVSATIAWTPNATGYRGAAYYKNGVVIPGSGVMLPSAGAGFASSIPGRTILLQLGVGDYVQLLGFQSSGGALSTYATAENQSTFSMSYQGA